MKTLVIVGSAPLTKDFSGFIDSCDCVVRFNNCKNYNINSGTKTDILVLNNAGNPTTNQTLAFMLKPRTKNQVRRELPYLDKAKQVWFVRPSAAFLVDFFKNRIPVDNRFREKQVSNNLNYTHLAIKISEAQNIPQAKIRYITTNLFVELWEKLLVIGKAEGITPSTGMLGIEMLVSNPSVGQYKKYIVGFRWQGWKGHPWRLEKQLTNDYLKKGELILLDKERLLKKLLCLPTTLWR